MFASSSTTSLNSYGYSPHPLKLYLEWIYAILTPPRLTRPQPSKPFIISITSSKPRELEEMVGAIQELRARLKTLDITTGIAPSELVAIELNTSCPNIGGAPPPSYNFPSLIPLLGVLASAFSADQTLTIGLKLPPYLYATCFHDAVGTIASFTRPNGTTTVNPFAFITCINTLGSSLLFTDQVNSELSSEISVALPTPLGGLGGDAIHPIALGNVFSFNQLLSHHADGALSNITIFGVGGVTSPAAALRMFKAGAGIVEGATLLGQQGVSAFQSIAERCNSTF